MRSSTLDDIHQPDLAGFPAINTPNGMAGGSIFKPEGYRTVIGNFDQHMSRKYPRL